VDGQDDVGAGRAHHGLVGVDRQALAENLGHVGNAPALSKRSVMSTAFSSSAPVVPSRHTLIGVL
jgi:hypothetical protein